ncbi:MAG TPA: hypothetical protein VD789_13665, partial [Thermomicrobiales bacterium]|nr:hypothetical protein [Thermomicrobiales bacterium]
GQAIEAEGYEETPADGETAEGPPNQIISPADATVSADEPTEAMGSTDEPAEATDSQVIEAAGGQPASTPVTDDEAPIIVEDDSPGPPAETDTPVIQAAETPEGEESTVATGTGNAGFDLSEANFYSDGELWGDPNARLAFVDGQVAFTDYPDSVSLEHEFLTAQTASSDNQQLIEICSDGECTDATQDAAAEGATDTPIGWFADQLLYQRVTANGSVELRLLIWDAGTESAASDDLLTVLDGTVTPMGRAFPTAGGMLVPTMEAWLLVTDGDATVVDANPYGDIQLARTNFSEPYIAYVAGGQLIIAEQRSPGTAIATIPFGGVDFDISPDMDAVVVSTGNGIEIWSLDGQRIGASADTLQTGSVLWLSSGIVFIDQTNGNIRLLDPAVLTG